MSYDRDYERRRDEARRFSEEEGRRIKRELTDKIIKTDIAGMRAAGRAAQLSHEIERRKCSEELKTLLEDMKREKAFILNQISKCSSVRKDRWYQRLENIDLTGAGTDVELKNLFGEMEGEKRFWSNEPFKLPEWMKNLPGAHNRLSTRSESTPKSRPSFSLNAVELKLKQEQRGREMERELKESDLALIVSSLGLLISYRNRYKSVLSNL